MVHPGASGEAPQTSLAPDAEESDLDTSNYPDLASLDGRHLVQVIADAVNSPEPVAFEAGETA